MSTVNTKMTAIADEIRKLYGTSGKLGLDAMSTNIKSANTEVTTQHNLLEQAFTLLGGGSGSQNNIINIKNNTTKLQELLSVLPDAYDGSFKEIRTGILLDADDVALVLYDDVDSGGKYGIAMGFIPKPDTFEFDLANCQKLYFQYDGKVYECDTTFDSADDDLIEGEALLVGNSNVINALLNGSTSFPIYNGGEPFVIVIGYNTTINAYVFEFIDLIATESKTVSLKISLHPIDAIHIQADSSVQLNIAGKYCKQDIVVEVEKMKEYDGSFKEIQSGILYDGEVSIIADIENGVYGFASTIEKSFDIANYQKLYVQYNGEVYECDALYDVEDEALIAGNIEALNGMMNSGEIIYNGGIPFVLVLEELPVDTYTFYIMVFIDLTATEEKTDYLKISLSPIDGVVHIKTDSPSIQLNTSGKYCEQDIIVEVGSGQSYDGGFKELASFSGYVTFVDFGGVYVTIFGIEATPVADVTEIKKAYVQYDGTEYELETSYYEEEGCLIAGNIEAYESGVYDGGMPIFLGIALFEDEGYYIMLYDFTATEDKPVSLKISLATADGLHIRTDSNVHLNTAGKYCEQDILVEFGGFRLPNGISRLASGTHTQMLSGQTYDDVYHDLGTTPNFVIYELIQDNSSTLLSNSLVSGLNISKKINSESDMTGVRCLTLGHSSNSTMTSSVQEIPNSSSMMTDTYFMLGNGSFSITVGYEYRW